MFTSLKTLTPGQIARKVPRALRRRARQRTERVRDRIAGTRLRSTESFEIGRILPDLSVEVPEQQLEALAGVTRNYVAGRFSVLGSGWLPWTYGSPPPGREGHRFDPGPPRSSGPDESWLEGLVTGKNLPGAKRIWAMIEGPYEPIDWQLDARSGARWSARVHALDTTVGIRRGAEVKVPWELSRMQHLPRLALACGLSRKGEPRFLLPSEYERTYRNQVCDFLALNPPRFGVNWATAMEAGIRIANILIAHDLFRASGTRFDAAFEALIVRTAREHATFILAHLDWWDLDQRNNHYLANIAGLAFVGAYLPSDAFSETLLAFSQAEVTRELEHQFNADGSHFEGSTAYHAFSAEMVAWTVVILSAVDAPVQPTRPRVLPAEARRRLARFRGPTARPGSVRLAKAAAFLARCIRPDQRLLQVGDNDSARFLKLDVLARRTELERVRRRYLNLRELPEDPEPWWDERELDYGPTLALVREVAGSTASVPDQRFVAGAAARHLVGNAAQDLGPRGTPVNEPVAGTAQVHGQLLQAQGVRSCMHTFRPDPRSERLPDLADGLTTKWYPDFGLAILESPRLWMAVRVGGRIQADGGHAHADTLSFELHIDGRVYRVDPGAYVYTSLPWRRSQFRSHAAHGIPRLRDEAMVDDDDRVFSPAQLDPGVLLSLDQDGLVGRRSTRKGDVYRVIRVLPDRVEVIDLSASGQPIHVEPLPWWSPGYGRLVAFDAGALTDPETADAVAASSGDRPMSARDPRRAGSRHGEDLSR